MTRISKGGEGGQDLTLEFWLYRRMPVDTCSKEGKGHTQRRTLNLAESCLPRPMYPCQATWLDPMVASVSLL